MKKKDEHDDGQAVPLGMANVAGVFYVLIIGASFAVFHAIVSFLLHIFEHSRKLKVCSLYPRKTIRILSFITIQTIHIIKIIRFSSFQTVFHLHI